MNVNKWETRICVFWELKHIGIHPLVFTKEVNFATISLN